MSSKLIETAVFAVGGLSLFSVAFIGFAASSGVPLSEVAVIGPIFQVEPAEKPLEEPEQTEPLPMNRSDQEIVLAGRGILDTYQFPVPFNGDKLQSLVDELEAKKLALDVREATVVGRERAVKEREESVAMQFQSLEQLRAELDEDLAELEARASEVKRDVDSAAMSQVKTAETRAQLFKDGDAEELSERLTQFTPEEAARILQTLGSARASELLAALPNPQWKTYVDAYTSVVD